MSEPSSPWVRARGQVMFLIGLIVASAIILKIESAEFVPVAETAPLPAILQSTPAEAEAAWARIAADESSTVALADLGLRIKAALAAHKLSLINGRELHRRVSHAITIGSGRPVEDPGAVASYLSALELVAWGYPSLRNQATTELLRWSALPADQLMRTALLQSGSSQ